MVKVQVLDDCVVAGMILQRNETLEVPLDFALKLKQQGVVRICTGSRRSPVERTRAPAKTGTRPKLSESA